MTRRLVGMVLLFIYALSFQSAYAHTGHGAVEEETPSPGYVAARDLLDLRIRPAVSLPELKPTFERLDSQVVSPRSSTLGDEFLFLYALGDKAAGINPMSGLRLDTERGRVRMVPMDSQTPTRSIRYRDSPAVFYEDAYPDTDLVISQTAAGLAVLFHRRSDEAPTSFAWSRPSFQQSHGDESGSVEVGVVRKNLSFTEGLDLQTQFEHVKQAAAQGDKSSPDVLLTALDGTAESGASKSKLVELPEATMFFTDSQVEWSGFTVDVPWAWKEPWQNTSQGLGKRSFGGWEYLMGDGSIAYSHGPDPNPANQIPQPKPFDFDKVDPACTNPSQHQFSTIYAWTNQPTTNEIKYDIRNIIKDMSGRLDVEAKASGGPGTRFKFRCNEQGVPTVWQVKVPANATFEQIVSAAKAAGYQDWISKWLVFTQVDQSVNEACGLAHRIPDDSKWLYNLSNVGNASGTGYYPNQSYAVVFSGCWNVNPLKANTAIHEATHAMGGSQDSAPFATGAAHCQLNDDILCYADNGPFAYPQFEVCVKERYDCGKTTYFSANPPAGSYLGTHWNIGQSENYYLSRP